MKTIEVSEFFMKHKPFNNYRQFDNRKLKLGEKSWESVTRCSVRAEWTQTVQYFQEQPDESQQTNMAEKCLKNRGHSVLD